jgi:hypothetical protein
MKNNSFHLDGPHRKVKLNKTIFPNIDKNDSKVKCETENSGIIPLTRE